MTVLSHQPVSLTLAKARNQDLEVIHQILSEAIQKRKAEGSTQWQNGYPNLTSIEDDITKEVGYIVLYDNRIIGYFALIFNGEPTYEVIDGAWLNDSPYGVIHRIAVSQSTGLKGLGTQIMLLIEEEVRRNEIENIRIDTIFDNLAMLRILAKLGYEYCGEVLIRDGKRKAFQKILLPVS